MIPTIVFRIYWKARKSISPAKLDYEAILPNKSIAETDIMYLVGNVGIGTILLK
jgi:hypothetical protein